MENTRPHNEDGPAPVCNRHNGWQAYLPILLWVAGGCGIMVMLAVWIYSYANSPGPLSESRQIIYLPPHSSFRQIDKTLSRAKVIDDDPRFAILARILGAVRHLKAGEYRFSAHITPYDVLDEIQRGKTVNRVLTIAEGLNLTQAAQVIAQAGLADVKTVAALVRDPGFIKELGLHAKTLEGCLFPDTYFFKRGADIRAMLAMMVRRTGRVFAEECRRQTHNGLDIDCGLLGPPQHFVNYPTMPSLARRHKRLLRLSAWQALILASMVEKETGNALERPIIAQVFISRLRRHMRLQSDPTVMYGLQKFGRPLSRRDLQTPSPYNTYTLAALPAGPICSPGRAAIAAVMQPAGTNYYYFVAQGNGRHIFSQTLAAHNRAVRKYRRLRALKAD